ncbi:GlxA family transcriptional regulator [Billgrantia sp. Q4P2]|uniref:GlxA family transcriptional regulator n=1 Tax=Billgrantia sp. Q4P2 TaxID=3463857 RepID=UPI0040563A76
MTRHNQPFRDDDSPFMVGFLLFPQFAMLSFSSVIEPLRIANRMSGKSLYCWHLMSLDDRALEASNGLPFMPTLAMEDWQELDALILVAGLGTNLIADERLFQWLKKVGRSRRLLGSTSTGSFLLAKAGLLDRKHCTIHWENQASLQEEYPEIIVSNELFEIDQGIMTCSGGTAGLDMMLSLIERQHGSELAKQIAEQCIHPNIRSAHEKQRMSHEARLGVHNSTLIAAIKIMESHIEDPLSCESIAMLVDVSHRQMQRLFKQHFGITPANYYLNFRLEHGDRLLRYTSMPIIDIATATGFSSTSHFSKCYRKFFGISPKERRKT